MRGRDRRVLVAFVLTGCWQAHPSPPIDAGADARDARADAALDARADAPLDARAEPPDAGCVPIREIPDRCVARWARVFGTSAAPGDTPFAYAYRPVVSTDQISLVPLFVAWATASLDGLALTGGTAVALDPSGRAIWTPGPAATVAGDGAAFWIAPGDEPPSIAVVSPTDGAQISTLRSPGSVYELAVVPCESCSRSWFAQVGPGGVLTLLASDEAGPRWDVTFPQELTEGLGVVRGVSLPPAAMPDRSVTVVWHDSGGGSLPGFCPVEGGCVPPGGGIVVSYAPTGEIRWFFVSESSVGAPTMVSDGGVVVPIGADVVRFDAAGAELWRVAVGAPARAVTIDGASAVVWVALAIPAYGPPLTIGAAVARSCGGGAPERSTSLLARLDLASGTALDVRLPAEGLTIRGLAPLAGGGVLVVGSTYEDASYPSGLRAVTLCERTFASDDGTLADVVIAAVE